MFDLLNKKQNSIFFTNKNCSFRKLASAVCLVFLLSFFTCSPAQATSLGGHTSAEQAIMIDYQTGTVLLEKNADEKVATSSMSKVMTAMMVFDALRSKQVSLDTKLKVSEKAWRKGGSKMFVEAGDRVSVDDLLKGVLVQSGNDATIVLAEGLAGNEENFAEIMTARAHEIGMKNSNFVNASGWPDPEHYSTVRDLATMARYVIANYPEYFPYFSMTEFTYNNIRQTNRNPLLYLGINADGMKTGHTEDAGYGLIATGENNGRRVILVLNGIDDEKSRSLEGSRLLKWGLEGFRNSTLAKAGQSIAHAEVALGTEKTVPLTIAKNLAVTIPLSGEKTIITKAVYNSPLIAPVAKGSEIGTLKAEITPAHTIEIPLIASHDVSEKSFIPKTLAKAGIFFKNLISPQRNQVSTDI